MKAADEYLQKQVAGCIRAFFTGNKNINWVMAYIRGSQLPKPVLRMILTKGRSGAIPQRYEELVKECQERGFL